MIDEDSPTWRAVAALIQEAEQYALAELASPALDYPNTQRVRGQLLALRAVRALPNLQNYPFPLAAAPEGY